MFCANCGAENEDGVTFCARCGKSPNEVVVKNEDKKMENYPLINLSSKLFYPMFELWLWNILIIGTVGGGIAGYWIGRLSYRDGGGTGAFLGVIIGFFLSFVGMVNLGGKTAITLKANAEKVLKKGNIGTTIATNLSNTSGQNNESIVVLDNPYKAIDSINIREKPDLASSYVFKLTYNETVSLIETGEKISDNNYWVHVKNKNGKDGWCYLENLKKID